MNRGLTICLNASIIFKSTLKCFFTIARELFCTEQAKDRLMDFRTSSREGCEIKIEVPLLVFMATNSSLA